MCERGAGVLAGHAVAVRAWRQARRAGGSDGFERDEVRSCDILRVGWTPPRGVVHYPKGDIAHWEGGWISLHCCVAPSGTVTIQVTGGAPPSTRCAVFASREAQTKTHGAPPPPARRLSLTVQDPRPARGAAIVVASRIAGTEGAGGWSRSIQRAPDHCGPFADGSHVNRRGRRRWGSAGAVAILFAAAAWVLPNAGDQVKGTAARSRRTKPPRQRPRPRKQAMSRRYADCWLGR